MQQFTATWVPETQTDIAGKEHLYKTARLKSTGEFVGLREYNDMELSWYTFVWKPGVSWLDHIECLRKGKLGIDLPADRVPDSMYYGFLNGAIIGRLSLRHELNEFLRTRGGHIGYSVAPKFRGFGFAQEMLKQVLPKAKALGMSEILITCDDDNTASWKVIEAC